MGSLATFVIVSKADLPLYEADLGTGTKKEDAAHLHQFVIHAAQDFVEERMWETPMMNLKLVDRFNEMMVYGFVTAGGARFLLLHDVRNEENVKNFFYEVHELYLRVMLNPFHTPRTPITSPVFDARVRSISRKHGFAG